MVMVTVTSPPSAGTELGLMPRVTVMPDGEPMP
jgi:hypothetical protein